MQPKAMLIGNSDGIGLATTKRLLAAGWRVTGVSRSESPIADPEYRHICADVCDPEYTALVHDLAQQSSLDLCMYFAGIGELLNPLDMSEEARIMDVNLTGMIRTASAVVPLMVTRGQGHFIGVSSVADELVSAEAPSYHASKAGFSNYLRGLGLALKPKGVHVTTMRFGFVDTKMAKGDVKPFMMSVDKAVDHVETCMSTKPLCYTAPKIVIPLIKLKKLMMMFGQ